MPTILDENSPLNEHLAGEQDDHMRDLKERVKDLIKLGHHLSDTYPLNSSADGQLKFGERVASYSPVTGTLELDLNDGTIHVVTVSDALTLTFSDPPGDGTNLNLPVIGYGFLLIQKQATSGDVITFGATINWPNDIAPDQGTGAGIENHYSFFTIDGGATWYGSLTGVYYV